MLSNESCVSVKKWELQNDVLQNGSKICTQHILGLFMSCTPTVYILQNEHENIPQAYNPLFVEGEHPNMQPKK